MTLDYPKIIKLETREDIENLEGLTPQQRRVLNTFLSKILEHDGYGSDDYEYKKFEITLYESFERWGTVWLTTEVGRKGDEGTLAQAFARTYRLISIGKRGGTALHNARDRRYKKRSAKHSVVKKGQWNCLHCLTSY